MKMNRDRDKVYRRMSGIQFELDIADKIDKLIEQHNFNGLKDLIIYLVEKEENNNG